MTLTIKHNAIDGAVVLRDFHLDPTQDYQPQPKT